MQFSSAVVVQTLGVVEVCCLWCIAVHFATFRPMSDSLAASGGILYRTKVRSNLLRTKNGINGLGSNEDKLKHAKPVRRMFATKRFRVSPAL